MAKIVYPDIIIKRRTTRNKYILKTGYIIILLHLISHLRLILYSLHIVMVVLVWILRIKATHILLLIHSKLVGIIELLIVYHLILHLILLPETLLFEVILLRKVLFIIWCIL